MIWNGAVLCAAAGDPSHVHGGFGSCPFEVALVGVTKNHAQVFACIYSSETRTWSDLVAAATPFTVYCVSDQGTLVGNALFWLPVGLGYGILEFNLDKHSLDMIEWPSSIVFQRVAHVPPCWHNMAVLASPFCHTIASKCGRGRSALKVLLSGCCRRLICARFMGGSLGQRSPKTLGNLYPLPTSPIRRYL
ncbi:hypothetical protein PVAP13_6NG162603 [Panicum virgatum]|uniref:Uncharacterized protein n=1 Tax=Panicum virgatum TaxID=38727 RepID=A0A8T0QYT5_PANVG|nr:hypothetical protein PVAP13_6NG162603 [Panicum virgatum]